MKGLIPSALDLGNRSRKKIFHLDDTISKRCIVSPRMYVWLRNNHYDLITSMTAFTNKDYYCDLCDKGYQHKP